MVCFDPNVFIKHVSSPVCAITDKMPTAAMNIATASYIGNKYKWRDCAIYVDVSFMFMQINLILKLIKLEYLREVHDKPQVNKKAWILSRFGKVR